MPTELIGLVNGIVRLLTVMLEGVPVEQRTASATVWFFLWWPLGKRILKRVGFSEAELDQVEANVKGVVA